MNLRQRLRRAEHVANRLGYLSCPSCRERHGRTVLVNATSSAGWEEGDPQPCVACGSVPEQIVVLTEVIVSAREPS
jgi:hypothetical protein